MKRPVSIDPHTALAPKIERLENAVLVPFDTVSNPKRVFLGGVLRSDGRYVEASACHIDENRTPTRRPALAGSDTPSHHPGAWLYGGRFDLRFGHFLVETIARLWALDHIKEDITGVAFLPPRPKPGINGARVVKAGLPLYRCFADLPEPQVFTAPTVFDRLYVPPQGCGAGQLAVGCPEFVSFGKARFRVPQHPSGGKKLYVSRTRLGQAPGQVLAEEAIERALQSEGYEIFHPQDHTLTEQIARIHAADWILGVEGSAFHMVAYAAHSRCKIGVIRRRTNNSGVFSHCASFHGARAIDLSAIEEEFIVAGSKYPISNAVLNLPTLAAQLVDHRFVSADFVMPALSAAQREAAHADLVSRLQVRPV